MIVFVLMTVFATILVYVVRKKRGVWILGTVNFNETFASINICGWRLFKYYEDSDAKV